MSYITTKTCPYILRNGQGTHISTQHLDFIPPSDSITVYFLGTVDSTKRTKNKKLCKRQHFVTLFARYYFVSTIFFVGKVHMAFHTKDESLYLQHLCTADWACAVSINFEVPSVMLFSFVRK